MWERLWANIREGNYLSTPSLTLLAAHGITCVIECVALRDDGFKVLQFLEPARECSVQKLLQVATLSTLMAHPNELER
jgi:hypothetical protein